MTTRRDLSLVILANAALRIAGGASGVLVGVYIADSADRGFPFDAALVGALAATSFGAELAGAIPMGVIADAIAARWMMTGGALIAAVATALFGWTRHVGVFFISRALEGLAAAASVPALLAHIVDETAHDTGLRARTMSYFELSLLAGIAIGGVIGSQLWRALSAQAFGALALLYAAAAVMLFIGGAGSRGSGTVQAVAGLWRSLEQPALRRLAPIWLCMNAIVGLWLGPTLYFLLTRQTNTSQLLAGLFARDPQQLGWLLVGYSLVFGSGLVAWSVALPRTPLRRALQVSLVAMVAVSAGLLLLNHAGRASVSVRWTLTAILSILVMVESGFTPAALALLAAAVGPSGGRGAAMGIYSFLLSVGALAGNLLGGLLGQRWAIDGLIFATVGLALVALGLLTYLEPAGARA